MRWRLKAVTDSASDINSSILYNRHGIQIDAPGELESSGFFCFLSLLVTTPFKVIVNCDRV